MAAPSANGLDIIDVEVHGKSIRNIANEMAITLMRTSGSPVVTEALDFSTCILDREVEQLAFAGFVTFHISTAIGGVKAVLAKHDLADLRPGDGFLCNDPHTSGAIHQGDLGVVMPFFHNGEVVAFGYVNEHVLDAGGSAVSGFAPAAHDNTSEALNFNAVRVIRDYKIEPEWEAFIGNNVRLQRIVLNDIRSMIAANSAGERRLRTVIDDIGYDRFTELNEASKDLSEKAMRDVIRKLPDGTFDSEDWVEYDGRGPQEFHNVRCRLVVDGETMTIQYRGDAQTDSFINGAWPAMVGQSWSTLLSQLAYDIPVNAGLWRPITFDLGPAGTIVNSLPPAPVTQSHMETGMRANKILIDVLSQACSFSEDPVIASRVAGAPCQNLAFFTSYGIDLRSGYPTVAFPVSLGQPCGGGAQTVTDGLDTYAAQCMCGCNTPDVEMEESSQPGYILWRQVSRDQAGAGVRRGGMGVSGAMAVVHSNKMTGGGYNSAAYLPPRGAAGGYPAGAGEWQLLSDTNVFELLDRGEWPTRDRLTGTRVPHPAKTGALMLKRGDVFAVVNGGGGGVGDPLLRIPEEVAKDVRDGYVSATTAERLYGVILDNHDRADVSATEAKRTALRHERVGHETAPVTSPSAVFAPVRVASGHWECALCDHRLAAQTENWRVAAVSRETKIHEALERVGAQVRQADTPEPIVMRENFCPNCGSALAVDVTFAGRPPVAAPRLGVLDPYVD
ncbi:hydantoinase B/oxoprolinase family protein [Amycolatopsis echigonensis]|uniref:Hydantoinase B/oxoprolinase family protein n=1 Tax=Amycolatopsis echigonensis TaxID=2576905 RepID=A0A8E2B7W3_9PSEU|nr:hydantoinase B/oxoprolinase family protein [Amycolatopsis echigonensis]MBB2502353.1 hydantoinase B/oxoprolinase family protein [Amycolatopsis echigonensis]